jgi:hypothetical protein
LGKAEVDNSLGQEVDDIASESREAAWNGINSHVWSTGSKHISNFTWHITLLSDVSGKKAALRKSNGVEFSLEIFVGSNLLAGLLGDSLEVVEDLSDEWKANFDAVNWSFSCSSNLFIELKVSWVDASISESMEHSSWYTLIGVISGNFFSDNGVIISVGGIKWRIMMFLVSRVGFELCTPLFLGIFDQGALFVDIFWCRISSTDPNLKHVGHTMVFTQNGANLIEKALMSGILFQVITSELDLTPIEGISMMNRLHELIT